MRLETEQKIQAWCEAYEQLAAISMEQFTWLKENLSAEPDGWQAMQAWARRRSEIRAEIEKIQQELLDELGAEKVKAIFGQKIAKTAETARVLTFEAARKIEHAMINIGSQLDRARIHRKLTKAYADAELGSGHEAYFFDEKK